MAQIKGPGTEEVKEDAAEPVDETPDAPDIDETPAPAAETGQDLTEVPPPASATPVKSRLNVAIPTELYVRLMADCENRMVGPALLVGKALEVFLDTLQEV